MVFGKPSSTYDTLPQTLAGDVSGKYKVVV
jgi:hypothetical protein